MRIAWFPADYMDSIVDGTHPDSNGVGHTLHTLVVSLNVSTRITHGAHRQTYFFAVELEI